MNKDIEKIFLGIDRNKVSKCFDELYPEEEKPKGVCAKFVKKNKAYLINNIDDFGKLIIYCIYKDISVWRTYYDDRDKGKFCCNIDWKDKRCYYGRLDFFREEGYEIVIPKFEIDKYGMVQLLN